MQATCYEEVEQSFPSLLSAIYEVEIGLPELVLNFENYLKDPVHPGLNSIFFRYTTVKDFPSTTRFIKNKIISSGPILENDTEN